MTMNNKITPDGTGDRLFEECAAETEITGRIAEVFEQAGYRKVRTPGLEYLSAFASSASYYPPEEMYKLSDSNSGPVFGVKAAENDGNGVKVTEVVAGLPGQKAGFEVGDVILEINGTTIGGEQAYSDAIDRAGSVARMKVLCGKTGQTHEVDVELNK